MVSATRKPLEERYAAAAVILLLAPAPMHGSLSYAAALKEIQRRHHDAEVIPDAGLWEGLAAFFPPTEGGQPSETIEGFALHVADPEDWRRYAVPVIEASKAGAGKGAA